MQIIEENKGRINRIEADNFKIINANEDDYLLIVSNLDEQDIESFYIKKVIKYIYASNSDKNIFIYAALITTPVGICYVILDGGYTGAKLNTFTELDAYDNATLFNMKEIKLAMELNNECFSINTIIEYYQKADAVFGEIGIGSHFAKKDYNVIHNNQSIDDFIN